MNFEESFTSKDNSSEKPKLEKQSITKNEHFDDFYNLDEAKKDDEEMSFRELEVIRKDLSIYASKNISRNIEKIDKNSLDLLEKKESKNDIDGIFQKIRDNKWIRKILLASTLVGGMFLSNRISAQTENKEDGAIKTELLDNKYNNQDDVENKQEKIRLEFFELLNKMGDLSDKYPDSPFMEKWSPDKFRTSYYNDNLFIPKKNALGVYSGEGVEKHSINFTRNQGEIENFDINKKNGDVNIWIRYNKIRSNNVIVLELSDESHPNFKKMTVRDFENKYMISGTSVPKGRNKNNSYVWVNENINEDEILNKTLFDLNDESILPNFNDKIFKIKE